MKKVPKILFALFLLAPGALADSKPQAGIILSHTSVACATKKSKKHDIELLCQQYVVRAGSTDYTIRQAKSEELELIPLNTAIRFTLDKNKMKFKVNGTSFKFVVVSQAAASASADGANSSGYT